MFSNILSTRPPSRRSGIRQRWSSKDLRDQTPNHLELQAPYLGHGSIQKVEILTAVAFFKKIGHPIDSLIASCVMFFIPIGVECAGRVKNAHAEIAVWQRKHAMAS